MFVEVAIPPHRLAAVRSDECATWMLEHSAGSVIGIERDDGLVVAFEVEAEARAFEARWLAD